MPAKLRPVAFGDGAKRSEGPPLCFWVGQRPTPGMVALPTGDGASDQRSDGHNPLRIDTCPQCLGRLRRRMARGQPCWFDGRGIAHFCNCFIHCFITLTRSYSSKARSFAHRSDTARIVRLVTGRRCCIAFLHPEGYARQALSLALAWCWPGPFGTVLRNQPLDRDPPCPPNPPKAGNAGSADK
jgi:hypothetical protein